MSSTYRRDGADEREFGNTAGRELGDSVSACH